MYPPKMQRKCLSLETKMQVIRRIEAGERQADIGRSLDLAGSTIRTIVKNADKIKATVGFVSPVSARNTTRSRSSLMEKMEQMLGQWIKDRTKKGLPVNKDVIVKRALDTFKRLKNKYGDTSEHFVASRGWYERFRRRRNIPGESSSPDFETLEVLVDIPVDGEGYEENAALGGAPQIVVPDENGDTDVENSSNIFTYIPEAQFQTSEQDRTFIPETSFETCEQFIKIENNGRKKSNLKLLDQRQLENSEQRICNAIEELREISASVRSAEKEDEFDLFGRSIAEQLRQLPLEDALSIQLKLQTVVTEARLKATKSKARLENGVSDN